MSKLTELVLFLKFVCILKFVKIREFQEFLKPELSIYAELLTTTTLISIFSQCTLIKGFSRTYETGSLFLKCYDARTTCCSAKLHSRMYTLSGNKANP